MYDAIEAGNYEVKMSRPIKSEFNICECGTVCHGGSYCSNCGKTVNVFWEDDYKTAVKMYHADRHLLRKQFKKDAMDYAGIPTIYPKYDAIFEKAWESGHSNGLWQVVLELEELADLIVF